MTAPNYQMKRLRDMLDADGIPWHDNSDGSFCRTQSDEYREYVPRSGKPYDVPLFSVICGDHAYGALEMWLWPRDADAVGVDTAEKVMDRIRRAM